MSGSPDYHLATVVSRRLARHATGAELRREVEAADLEALAPDQAEAPCDLRTGLRTAIDGGDLELLVRETGRGARPRRLT